MAPSYLTRKRLIWQFQIGIPKDLQAVVGQKVVRRSLKTTDHRVATIKAAEELKLALAYFDELRASILTDEQRQKIVEDLRALGHEVKADAADLRAEIAAIQARERSEIGAWLHEKHTSLLALDPDLDVARAIEPHRAKGLAALRKLEDIAALAGTPKPSRKLAVGLTLDALFERWKRERKPAPRSAVECEFTVRRFRELHGLLPIADITRKHVGAFRDALLQFPIRMSNEEARLSFPEILRRYEDLDVPRSSSASASKRLTFLSTLFRLAVDAGDLQENPAAGIRIAEVERKQRYPFSASDLTAIFSRPLFVAGGERGSLYWLMLLGLFTGARLGELLQLGPADIKVSNGIDFIDITTEGGRRLKTEGSRRRVPIHPQLKALGFVDWAREREGALFAKMIPAEGQVSKHATRALGNLIRKAGIEDKLKTFHSFRHSFKDACREAEVEEAVHDALTGHAGGGVGRRYGSGFSLAVLAAAVDELRWPVDLAPLMPALPPAESAPAAE
jgi:integrase